MIADTIRLARFGGQPYFNDFLSNNYKSGFTNAFGEKNGKAMISATAGSSVFLSTLPLNFSRRNSKYSV